MPDSHLINVLAVHDTAETAPPTAPALGSNVADWATPAYKVFGAPQFNSAHDYHLTRDKISLVLEEELAEIKPPRAQAVQDYVVLSQAIQDMTFRAWGLLTAMYAHASNITTASSKTTAAGSLTARTVIIEITGIMMIHLPKVYLMFNQQEMGYGADGFGAVSFNLKPTEGTSIAAGWELIHYV